MTRFEELYRAYFNDVYRYIRRLSGDEGVADEITSETFFKAMRGLDGFRGDCDPRVWLCQIAKNCYFTYLKSASRTENMEDAKLVELPSPEPTAEELCLRREEVSRVRTVLHTLPEPYKEVFMWRVLAELSFSQIGKIFGKSDNWACVTYHRAKAMIKLRLEEQTYEK